MKINKYLSFLLAPLLFAVSCSGFALETDSASETQQTYVYDVYYKKVSIGKMIRELQIKKHNIKVNTIADLSFLLMDFGGSQVSDIYWDEKAQLYFSKRFLRNSSGFSSVSMAAQFDNNGHNTRIVNNGVTTNFSNPEQNIVDFNAIPLQISKGLKKGQTDFEFFMQTSDSIAHYFFKVDGKEVIDTKFGKFDSYRVEQIKKNDRTFIAWFATELDHQMVKFIYKRNLLDIRGELHEYSNTSL
ncbi:DUF3108 domain-containing protein [Psychromonas sp.]|uniref:DUF3108 domain-containing protein n=1 Tax=Psychromonas sp. TaxID=1884585 RepID=UPI00356220A7